MGSGKWDAATYASVTRSKVDSGKSFGYSRVTAASAPTDRKAHDLLDPKRVNNDGAYTGKNVRESLDSNEHPAVTSIAVGLDVTGSNISDARIVQQKLPTLLGVLMRTSLIEHPQISIGAMGDAYVDRVPLQFAPFESDNRIDDHLDNIFLESGGGGNDGESYGLYLWFLARHTHLDSFEKRGKKGYAFLIADEKCLPTTPDQIERFIGDTDAEKIYSAKELFRMAEEKFEVFVLVPHNGTAEWQGSLAFYRDVMGDRSERVIDLDHSENISEIIGALVRAMEGDELDDIDGDLKALGADENARQSVSKVLATVGGGGGAIAVADLPFGLDEEGEEEAQRL